MHPIGLILRTGAAVFGGSAVPLLLAPGFFAELLGLIPSPELNWSLRMTSITVLALAGNMFVNAAQSDVTRVRQAGTVMLVSAAGLGIVTLLLPGGLNWFGWLYATLGFGFSAAYAIALWRDRRTTPSPRQ